MIFIDWLKVNENNHLTGDGCDLVEVAREFGTPLYVYSETEIRRRCREYREAMEQFYADDTGNGGSLARGQVIYAGKAFLTTYMCRLLAEEGFSLDVVSGGELYTALKAGYPADRIFFHGNNKSVEELEMALDNGVGRIVADSFTELETLGQLAAKRDIKARVIIRLKPGIEAHTHEFIRTGQNDSKFGLGIEDGQAMAGVKQALGNGNIELKGFHCHIGSQIFDVHEPFRLAARVMIKFMDDVRREAGFTAGELNLGGGLGIKYASGDNPVGIKDFVRDLCAAVQEACRERDYPLPVLMMEPGRSIVGEAGLTLYTVGTVKDIPGVRTYVSVDGGMMDNLRVALYDAGYEAVLANRASDAADSVVTLAGKACESGDILIRDLRIPGPERGDIVAVFSTGAYHFSMFSGYNRNPRPAVVFLRDGRAGLVVERESYDDIIRNEVMDCFVVNKS